MAVSLSSNATQGTLSYNGVAVVNFNAGGIVGGLMNSSTQNSFAIPTGSNAMMVGPIALSSGQQINIAPGARLVIL